jgi:hypothetical protein
MPHDLRGWSSRQAQRAPAAVGASLLGLRGRERERLIDLLPQMKATIEELRTRHQAEAGTGGKIIAQISPKQA